MDLFRKLPISRVSTAETFYRRVQVKLKSSAQQSTSLFLNRWRWSVLPLSAPSPSPLSRKYVATFWWNPLKFADMTRVRDALLPFYKFSISISSFNMHTRSITRRQRRRAQLINDAYEKRGYSPYPRSIFPSDRGTYRAPILLSDPLTFRYICHRPCRPSLSIIHRFHASSWS